jgi:hypothetical protein
MREQVIRIHPEAPAKPALGAACNGCGVCCLAEPCPVGMLVSRRRQGACRALQWQAEASRYRCGMVVDPQRYLPRPLAALAPWVSRLTLRLIAGGKGCDSDAQVSGD